jgi:Ca-activated chloride channel homolog
MIRFDRPELLFGLLLLPLVALLLIRRAGKRETVVPSLWLWQQAAAEASAEAGRRLGAFDLPLWLALLVLATTLLAASGPVLDVQSTQAPSVLLLVDRSASMATLENGETRLAWSVRHAVALLDAIRPQSVVLVGLPFDAGPAPVEQPWADASKTLRGLTPTDLPLEIADAVSRGAPLARQASMTLVLTDQPGEVPPALAGKPVAVISRGDKADNRAIEVLEITPHDAGLSAFISVRNHASTAKSVIAREATSGQTAEINLPPNAAATHLFEGLRPDTARIDIRLDPGDTLRSDNRAVAVRPHQAEFRVAYVGRGNAFLLRALGLLPGVAVRQFQLTSDVTEAFDLYIYDGVTPKSLPPGDVVLIDPVRLSGPVQVTGARRDADGLRVVAERPSPLLADIDVAALRFKRLLRFDAPNTAEPLLKSGDAAALLRWTDGPSRVTAIGCGLTPADTNWPMLPSFPIFWSNLLADLAGTQTPGLPAYHLTGERIVLRVPADGQLTVTDPRGEAVGLTDAAGARKMFIPQFAGIYTLTENGLQRFLAVNMMHPGESGQASSRSKPSVSDVRSRLANVVGSGVPLWRPLGGTALVLAFAFWMTSARHRP